ncbi:MAG TPA: hypothetical protein VG937_12870 [Polyangiaceae bacterium]|jgi:hypothetical protein|nr:hypothetical protein [Polyangiaceae bacterium]
MMRTRALALLASLALLACSGAAPEEGPSDPAAGYACDGAGARFATGVTHYEFGTGQSFGQDHFPEAVLGPPNGGGCCAGSLDVTSLGDGGFVVLEFEHNVIIDEAGPDFLVFENPFQGSESTPETVFAELATVSVSQDGETWFDYPCTADAYPFGACAGWHPVYANSKNNEIDPLSPEVAGGDAFDLADVGLEWARYVRITDRPEADGGEGTFDLDAAAIVNPGCP